MGSKLLKKKNPGVFQAKSHMCNINMISSNSTPNGNSEFLPKVHIYTFWANLPKIVISAFIEFLLRNTDITITFTFWLGF